VTDTLKLFQRPACACYGDEFHHVRMVDAHAHLRRRAPALSIVEHDWSNTLM
jgi:hypothetical protein